MNTCALNPPPSNPNFWASLSPPSSSNPSFGSPLLLPPPQTLVFGPPRLLHPQTVIMGDLSSLLLPLIFFKPYFAGPTFLFIIVSPLFRGSREPLLRHPAFSPRIREGC
jgi:hypothetical protein